jgi:hypothetical protein
MRQQNSGGKRLGFGFRFGRRPASFFSDSPFYLAEYRPYGITSAVSRSKRISLWWVAGWLLAIGCVGIVVVQQ